MVAIAIAVDVEAAAVTTKTYNQPHGSNVVVSPQPNAFCHFECLGSKRRNFANCILQACTHFPCFTERLVFKSPSGDNASSNLQTPIPMSRIPAQVPIDLNQSQRPSELARKPTANPTTNTLRADRHGTRPSGASRIPLSANHLSRQNC